MKPKFFIHLVISKANSIRNSIEAELNSSRRDEKRLERLRTALDRLQDAALSEVSG